MKPATNCGQQIDSTSYHGGNNQQQRWSLRTAEATRYRAWFSNHNEGHAVSLVVLVRLAAVSYSSGHSRDLRSRYEPDFVCWRLNFLTIFIVMYISRKGSIAGPRFKIPFMGPFASSTFQVELYLAQWASGPLSCVSVFHKQVDPRTVIPLLTIFFLISQVRGSRLRSGRRAQSLQDPQPCDTMYRAHRERHDGLESLDFPTRPSTRRVPSRLYRSVYKQSAWCILVCPGAGLQRLLRQVRGAHGGQRRQASQVHGMFREINCALSCRTFFSDYISQDALKRIADDFHLVRAALELVNVPLSMYIPFTKPWLGK